MAEREQEIRARVERLRSAGPIDVAADPGMNALRMIAHSDAEDLAYLLEENQQLRQDNKKNLAAWTNDLDGLRADLAAARAEVGRLREALARYGRHKDDCEMVLWAREVQRTQEFQTVPACTCGWSLTIEASARAALAREDGDDE